jgi:hypothetical protein
VGMRRTLTVAALAGASLAIAAPASAQDNKIFKDFQKNGQINPCNYSKGQLQRGLHDLPPDIQQYAPGLADQLRRPCATTAPATPTASTPEAQAQQQAVLPTSRRKARIPSPPAPRGKTRGGLDVAAPAVSAAPTGPDVPGWLQLLLGLVAVGGLGTVLLTRYGGLDPESATRPLRSGLAEGGSRVSDVLADLRDRIFRR